MALPNLDRKPSPELLATALVAAVYVVWVLSLPAWPSQDGPVHLFYTQVLAQLFGHTDPVYPRFFYIKHLLPPYALYYYLLLLLSRVVPLLEADRLVICGYLAIFITGFHALARAIAPAKGADRATLLATLLLLNWPLGMGFVNYCLSLALALWALALWFRPAKGSAYRRGIGFVLLVLAVTLAHPVPLLLVLGVCALDLLTRKVRSPGASSNTGRADILTLALAALPLLYVRAFAARHLLAQRTVDAGPVARALARMEGYVQGKSVSLLFGRSLGVNVYRGALFATLLLALALAVLQLLRNRARGRYTVPDLFLVAALLLLFTLPWLPSEISGAYYFPERLILLVWIFALLAAAGWEPVMSPTPTSARSLATWATPLLLTFTCGASVALLVSANTALRPLAAQARAWEQTSFIHPGELVLFLEGPTLPPAKRIIPSWNPWYWMGVHAIRSNHAILANAPWLDSSIIPLAAQPSSLATAQLSPELANSPHALTTMLRLHPDYAATLTSAVSAVSFSPADGQPAALAHPLLLPPEASASSWSCQTTPDGGFEICRRLP